MIKKIIISCMLWTSVVSMSFAITTKTWVMLKARQSSLVQVLSNLYYPYIYSSEGLPNKVQLGMNGVPVYDQGGYGTCVTFATSAALEAKAKKGNYISQYCLLQLSSYMAKNTYKDAWWEGTYAEEALNSIEATGVIPKNKQSQCGKLGEYVPYTDDFDLLTFGQKIPEDNISLEKYHKLSEVVDFTHKAIDVSIPTQALFLVKTELASSHRTLLGFVVTSAFPKSTHITSGDTWALSSEDVRTLMESVSNLGMHEIIITGYDDKAVAYDSQGNKHVGLLKVRNSWGTDSGDHGDYYMSYDYFKAFVSDLQVII